MAQQLTLSNGDKIVVDRIFAGADKRPNAEIRGGQVYITDPGSPAPPRVAMRGEEFFYLTNDLAPVTKPEDVQHLPEEYKAKALKFIATKAASTKPLKPLTEAGAAREIKRATKRAAGGKRSHKKQSARPAVVIKDETSLARASGGVTVKV